MTVDDGLHWESTEPLWWPGSVLGKQVVVSRRGVLQISTDAASNWLPLDPQSRVNQSSAADDERTEGAAREAIEPSVNAVALTADHHVLVATDQGLGIAESDGTLWRWSASSFDAAPHSLSTIVGLAADGEVAFAVTAQSVWRSDDTGRTWRRLVFDVARGQKLVAVDTRASEVIVSVERAPGSVTLFRSTDLGQTWARVLLPESTPLEARLVPSPRGWLFAGPTGLWLLPFERTRSANDADGGR